MPTPGDMTSLIYPPLGFLRSDLDDAIIFPTRPPTCPAQVVSGVNCMLVSEHDMAHSFTPHLVVGMLQRVAMGEVAAGPIPFPT